MLTTILIILIAIIALAAVLFFAGWKYILIAAVVNTLLKIAKKKFGT